MRGSDGSKTVVTVSSPAPDCPTPEKPVDQFEDALRKRVVHAMMDPESIAALKQGLAAPQMDERRKWWQLGLQTILPVLEGPNGGGGGGVRITFNAQVPGPTGGEEGPIGGSKPLDVTPR